LPFVTALLATVFAGLAGLAGFVEDFFAPVADVFVVLVAIVLTRVLG